MFDEKIENQKNDMINTLSNLIKFKSVSEETNNPKIPFGEECSKALKYVLDLANSWGFKTKNLDGYCGYIEFGEGTELVGIIGHLDVVPAKTEDGWTNNPFSLDIRENKLYGRGTIDDKGPVVASLYAMKTILDSGIKLNKRVRLILGLNEEKDWKCINHYKEIGEEAPNIGFSPDADFPCIYAEKGILSIRLKHPFKIENIIIENIDCDNNALNVVPKYCSITLKLNSNTFNFKDADNISVEKIDNETVKIIATGTSAHAAHPDFGENAITTLIRYLNTYFGNNILSEFDKLGLFSIKSPEFLSKTPIQDETGILTSNVGFISYENETLELGLNLRVPVNTSLDEIKEKYKKISGIFDKLEVEFTAEQAPLYVSKNSYLVKTLLHIFEKKTGQIVEPIAVGGGTYARAFPNCVAFGPTLPGQKDMCHQVDEFIDLDTLVLSCKIYAEAIYELGK